MTDQYNAINIHLACVLVPQGCITTQAVLCTSIPTCACCQQRWNHRAAEGNATFWTLS